MNFFKLMYWCVMVALLGMGATSCTKKGNSGKVYHSIRLPCSGCSPGWEGTS